jgi:hypothetical protein
MKRWRKICYGEMHGTKLDASNGLFARRTYERYLFILGPLARRTLTILRVNQLFHLKSIDAVEPSIKCVAVHK